MEAQEVKTETAGTGSAEMEDRISILPDEVLLVVLKYLDTKQAVQTSVLGRRWKNLWSQLTVINIDSNSFRDYLSFRNVVLNVFSPKISTVHVCKFWFDFNNPIYSSMEMYVDTHDLFESLVQRVIRHVVTHGIRFLSFHFPRIVDDFPRLFTCPSLTMLELRELSFPPIRRFDFATLKTLKLVKCSFTVGGENEEKIVFDPFSGCLVLDTLFIYDCRIPFRVQTLEISAPELASLQISKIEHDRNISPNCIVTISSTKITSFVFVDSHILEFLVVGLPLLKRVDIDVVAVDYLYGTTPEEKRKFIVHLVDMFGEVGNAETVTLSLDTLDILSNFVDVLGCTTPFPGMKNLKVIVPHEFCSFTTGVKEVIAILLEGLHAASPVLEYLKLPASGSMGMR